MEFTRGIKSRSEIYRQRGKVCDGVAVVRFARPRCVMSHRVERKYRFTTIRRDGDHEEHGETRLQRVRFRREQVSDASVAHNGQSVGRKAPRKLRNTRRRDVLRM